MIAAVEWAQQMGCAATVCDTEGRIVYQNDRSIATFGNRLGQDMLGCHSERSRAKIAEMLSDGTSNAYTIEKGEIHKMIYQTPWYAPDGSIGGLVELSMPIPAQMPHYIRK